MPDVVLFGPCPPPYGGVSVYMMQLITHLEQQGIAFTLKTTERDGGQPHQQVIGNEKGIFQQFRFMDSNTVCVDSSVYFFEYPSYRRLPMWLLLKAIRRFKWVKLLHGGRLPGRYEKFSRIEKLLFKLSLASVDHFVTINDDLADWLKNEMKVKQPVVTIPSLLPPLTLNTSLSPDIAAILNQHEYHIISPGTMTPDYGFEYSAQAVEQVRKQYDIGLIFICGTHALDSDYQEKVLNNRPWITVLYDVAYPQTLALMQQCNLMIRGTRVESYGLSKVEAMWQSIPVIATPTGETRGMLLFDYGHVEQLTQQINAILDGQLPNDMQAAIDAFHHEALKNLNLLIEIITSQTS